LRHANQIHGGVAQIKIRPQFMVPPRRGLDHEAGPNVWTPSQDCPGVGTQ
jgi:hypothetical protein